MNKTPDYIGQIYLNANIRYLRKNFGWSQEELGARIGLNRGNIASYENGTAEPKICNLLKLAALFGVSIIDLTQKDLSQSSNGQLTPSASPIELEALHNALHRANELQSVMEGLRICCHFKMKNIEDASLNDLQVIAVHFEELFNTAQALMQEHKNLLGSLNGNHHLPGQTPNR